MITTCPAEAMRALSIQQPWAWAIAHGKKPVENRSWPVTYRGLLAIHASKKPDEDAMALIASRDRNSPLVKAVAWHTRLWTPPEYAYGAVVALVEVTGCHHSQDRKCFSARTGGMCSPWAVHGQFHIELAGVRPLSEPVPCRGALKLWPLPEEVEHAVWERLR